MIFDDSVFYVWALSKAGVQIILGELFAIDLSCLDRNYDILVIICRQSIKETPCWVEIQIHRALQLLDDLFNSNTFELK